MGILLDGIMTMCGLHNAMNMNGILAVWINIGLHVHDQ